MKKRFVAKKWKSSEQGMALIAAMMCLLLLTGLGLAALYNSTGDVAISGGFRRNVSRANPTPASAAKNA